MTQKRIVLSLVLKITVVLSCIAGVILSYIGNKDLGLWGGAVFMFFTIQSNILIALICLAGAIMLISKHKPGNNWYLVKFVGTVAITLTCIVFCFVLAPTLADKAWNVQNVLTHVVVPILSITDLFVTGIDAVISRSGVLFIVILPLFYVIYAGIGYALNWDFVKGKNYPYFFLNWGSPAGALGFTNELPYMGCVWWILLILLLLMGIGFLYRYLIIVMRRKKTS